MMTTERPQEVRIAPSIRSYCLALSERWQQDDCAILGTLQGEIMASPKVFENYQVELTNMQHLLRREGCLTTQLKLADAKFIRTLLQNPILDDVIPLHHSGDRTHAQQALVDIVSQALALEASDIHLEFFPTHASLSYRVHGKLSTPERRHRESLAAAVAASLNTQSDDFRELFDEQRLSSASISLAIETASQRRDVRLRTQKSPTREGFAVTMRIQRDAEAIMTLEQLGFEPGMINALQQALDGATGMLLICGPTGHGKTTTLAGLNARVPSMKKIISLEDPIEIVQPGIQQKVVQADHPELNFANMIKVALREDPDVISVSEIRDKTTAMAAYTAALTGHLVTATVHAFDGFGALQRLQDLGLNLTELAQPGVLLGILSQRLVDSPKHAKRQVISEYLPMTEVLRVGLLTGDLITTRRQLETTGWCSLRESLTCHGHL